MNEVQIGEWLCERGILRKDQLEHALQVQINSEPHLPIAAVLISLKWVTEKQICEAFAAQMGTEICDLEAQPPDISLKGSITPALAQSIRVIPHSRENGYLRFATAAPVTPADRGRIEFIASRPVKFLIAAESAMTKCLQEMYGLSVESLIAGLTDEKDSDLDGNEVVVHDLREMAQEPTLVNLVNAILSEAIDERASDIHFEPFEAELKVKYRIDGILQEMPPPPKQFQSAIISRIKIMSGLDIAERYVPQDGQIRVNLPKAKVDIRVSTVPTVFGESVVLRLLNKDESKLQMRHLGIDEHTHHKLSELLKRPYGIVLVCGPTGSGKSTTLYSALHQIFTPEKKIITIEDPVEYQISGINQIPVRPKRGLTFATGLRAILRQDPDIIMVGEIRDRETADISIRAALTGHLVFSTLHTNDAPGAVTRLIDMGVEPFLIASSVQGILGQRLIRKLCPHCRRPVDLRTKYPQLSQTTTLPRQVYEPGGCEECHGRGYHGRLGIFELLTITDALHDLILRSASSGEIKEVARKNMRTMRMDGWDKVRDGSTSVTEIMQATQFDDADED